MIIAKKHLGQHFLKSEKALSQIVDAGDIHASDLILEIGPGTGLLTNRLLERTKSVLAIEKDRELITYLHENFADAIAEKRLEIIEGDVLEFNPFHQLKAKKYKVIANIPYYITGAIIEQFLSASLQPSRMVLLIQKEVAERIVARDGKESVLSIAVKVYGTPSIVAKVPAGAFNPPPKVDSAILLVSDISRTFFDGCDENLFFSILKSVFGKKRKQLGGSLSEFLNDKTAALHILSDLSIDPKTRPERLTPTDWKNITVHVQKIVQ